MSIFHLLAWLIEAYIWLIMFPYAILSWFRIRPGTTLARIQYFLYQATEPVLRPVRRIIRPDGRARLLLPGRHPGCAVSSLIPVLACTESAITWNRPRGGG